MASKSQKAKSEETTPPETVVQPEPVHVIEPLSIPALLQRQASKKNEEAKINVRLLIDGSDADGVRHYDEELPVALVRAILNPEIQDFFIPINGVSRPKPVVTKSHWLHTSYIREVLLLAPFDLEG